MPILGTIASSKFTAIVAPASFESIATVTVGAGGSSSISFSSIPTTYKHLQVRFIARSNRGITTDAPIFRFNGDSTSSNYSQHALQSDGGGTVSAFSETSAAPNNFGGIRLTTITAANSSANMFGVGILDILDYNDTTKKKTLRCIGGDDQNSANSAVEIFSGVYLANNNALTSFTLNPYGGSLFTQYSQFALYGIKGA